MVAYSPSSHYSYIWNNDHFCTNIRCFFICLHVVLTKIKSFFLFFVSLTLILSSIVGCYFIAENFFFDKFFYQKSILHGYYPNLKPANITQFGERGHGVNSIDNHSPIFSESDANKFKVLVIGDSFTWGVGIKNGQRFAKLLESKLIRTKPTTVVSVSSPGWNTSEFLKYYMLATKDIQPDLTIFSLVHNDSLLSRYNRDDQVVQRCQLLYPQTSPVFGIDLNQMIAYDTPFTEVDQVFTQQHDASWSNSVNLCVLESNLANLPTQKAIYFLTDDYGGNNLYTIYTEKLKKYGKRIVSSSSGKLLPSYSNLWKNNANPYDFLTISTKESHPNFLANQMYADILYNEIASDSSFGLLK